MSNFCRISSWTISVSERVNSVQFLRKIHTQRFISGVSAAQEVLPSWDRQVQNLCFQVNNVIEKINAHAPDWAEKYLESQMST